MLCASNGREVREEMRVHLKIGRDEEEIEWPFQVVVQHQRSAKKVICKFGDGGAWSG